jgi:hypothetical protein
MAATQPKPPLRSITGVYVPVSSSALVHSFIFSARALRLAYFTTLGTPARQLVATRFEEFSFALFDGEWGFAIDADFRFHTLPF